MDDFRLRAELAEARAEARAMRDQLEGRIPEATAWLQRKVERQRAALDVLNRRVVTQRFMLRTIEEFGRGITRDEYLSARDAQSEQLRSRISEDPAA